MDLRDRVRMHRLLGVGGRGCLCGHRGKDGHVLLLLKARLVHGMRRATILRLAKNNQSCLKPETRNPDISQSMRA